MKAILYAAAAVALLAGGAAASEITVISPSVILMGEPAPKGSEMAEDAESAPMPQVITGAAAPEDKGDPSGGTTVPSGIAAGQGDPAEDGVAPDEQTGAIDAPQDTNETDRSTLPPPEGTDPVSGPVMPAPAASTVVR